MSDQQSFIPKRRFTYSFARDNGMVYLGGDPKSIVSFVGIKQSAENIDPYKDLLRRAEAIRFVQSPVKFEVMPDDIFERRLSEIYAADSLNTDDFADEAEDDLTSLADGLPATADLLDSEDDAPVIRLINALIAEAVKTKASDIHIEPYETALSVRLRIDGVLREVLSLPAKMTPVITSRIKVMARLDIAEKRVPQDGRISLAMGGKTVDVRVSTLPSRYGERVVCRLLDKSNAQMSLDQLGMPQAILDKYKRLLKSPNGVILVTGPTGSGKTTTLYGGLSMLNEPSRNILTVEDPVEYALDGIGQTQVNSKVGMTFAAGLRAILRQDPDVVMVGEIRDVETAEIAIQASLTGHLVLSTVHTKSAIGAITRLRDMGVEPFLLSSSIVGIFAQRLVRKLCESCKLATNLSAIDANLIGLDNQYADQIIYEAKGCPRCHNTGYEGRLGIYELIEIDVPLKRMIHDEADEMDMAKLAFADQETLMQSGAQHVLNGLTTIEEILRVAQKDEAS